MPPPLPFRALPPLPMRKMPPPLPIPMAGKVEGSNTPMAGKVANPLDGKADVRYGRLANPHLAEASGNWVSVQSSWLNRIRFVPYAQAEDAPEQMTVEQKGDFYIEFNDGAICKWTDFRYTFFKSYLVAVSKGVFHSRCPWKSNYTLERPTQYTGAALAARIAANS